MDDKPFRWNLQNKRSLEAMIATAMEPIEARTSIPRSAANQKEYGRSLKDAQKKVSDIDKMRTEMASALLSAESHSDELLECCARIIAIGAEYDLVFVGRSPESIFDHMSGLLFSTGFKGRLTLLQFSMRRYEDTKVNWCRALPALKQYFLAVALDPQSLMRRKRPVAFVDLISTGETIGNLMNLLKTWCADSGVDWAAVRRKIRIIGVVARKKSSPKTVRWQQEVSWVNILETGSIKNVSVTPQFWTYLGDHQHKTTISFSPYIWGNDEFSSPTRNVHTLIGLRVALHLFELGRSSQRRSEFSLQLSKQEQMRSEDLRRLVLDLRKTRKETSSHKNSGGGKPVPYGRN